jgi:protein-tyrosine phosphatase
MSEYYPNTSSRLLAGLDTLKQGLWSAGVEIEISCAAEYFMDEHFEYLIERNDILTLKNNYVLVEMSFFAPPLKLDEYLFKLQTKGYKPILAHPERYIYYSKNFDRFQDLKNRGCKMQLNLLSLLGHYGKEVKVLAEKLLENGLYDFAGTDTHNVGHIERLKTFLLDNSKNKIGTQFLNKKFLD